MIKKMIPVIFLLTSISLFAQAFDWEWQNPKPTGNSLNDNSVLSVNDVYMVGQASIVLKTIDGGTNWEIFYPDPLRREIESCSFVDVNTGYIVGQDDLFMKTTDGGTSWTDLAPPTMGEDFWSVAFVDADTGYAVGTNGTFIKTTDGGASFSAVTSPLTNTIYSIFILSADNMFVGTSSVSATQIVSQSTDYGVTWNDITGTVANSVYSIHFVDPDHGWLGLSSNKVMRTSDAGVTWTEVADFGSSSNYCIFFEDTLKGYTGDSGGDLNISTDGGLTWTETNLSTGSLRAIGGASITGLEALDAIIITGDAATMLKSTDDGTTWNNQSQFVYRELQRDIEFIDNNTGFVVGGSTTSADSLGYILKTTDGGNTWFDLGYNFNFQVYAIDIPATDIIYAARGNNELFKSTDGGTTFVQQTSPISSTTIDFYALDFFDADNGYAGSSSGYLIKTTDGGTTWTEITPSPFGTSTIYDLIALNAQTAIATGTSNKIFMTNDGGTTWSPLFASIPGSLFAIEFYDNTLGYIGGYDSPNPQLAKTTDGGLTWNPITFPAGFDAFGSVWGIGLPNATTVWCSDVSGHIFYSLDAGANWTVANQFTQNGFYGIAIAGGDMWLCGANGSIVKGYSDPAVPVELTSFAASVVDGAVSLAWSTATETNNSGFSVERKSEGENWNSIGFVQGNGTTAEISTYSFTDEPDFEGSILYRLKQIDYDGSFEYSNIVEVVLGAPTSYSLEQNYPNPFNPTTTIEFSLPVSGMVTLKIYDVLGNEVASLINEEREQGTYKYHFDASEIASGVYMYELTAGEFQSTRKMMILK